jgi:hypothetical protein
LSLLTGASPATAEVKARRLVPTTVIQLWSWGFAFSHFGFFFCFFHHSHLPVYVNLTTKLENSRSKDKGQKGTLSDLQVSHRRGPKG